MGNQKGSILLMTLGLLTLMALILPILLMKVIDSSKHQSQRREVEEFVAMMASLRAQLENPLTCHTLLGGETAPASYNTFVSDVRIPWRYNGSPAAPQMGRDWKLPNTKVVIDDIKIYKSNNSIGETRIKVKGKPDRDYDQIPIRVYVYPKNLSLNYSNMAAGPGNTVKPEAVPGMKRRELMIRLIANVDQVTGRIYNCFGFESFAAACQAIGGAYNHTGPFDLKCQPDKNCFSSNLGLVTNPLKCAMVTSTIPYVPRAMGNFDGQMNYICRLCREDLP